MRNMKQTLVTEILNRFQILACAGHLRVLLKRLRSKMNRKLDSNVCRNPFSLGKRQKHVIRQNPRNSALFEIFEIPTRPWCRQIFLLRIFRDMACWLTDSPYSNACFDKRILRSACWRQRKIKKNRRENFFSTAALKFKSNRRREKYCLEPACFPVTCLYKPFRI